MDDEFDQRALDYHALHPAGKLRVSATKAVATQDDLSLAYSPGVAAPCLAIARDPSLAAKYTGRSNLVAVITNGTAVLGEEIVIVKKYGKKAKVTFQAP